MLGMDRPPVATTSEGASTRPRAVLSTKPPATAPTLATPAKAAQSKLEAEFGKREKELKDQEGKLRGAADKLEKDVHNVEECDLALRWETSMQRLDTAPETASGVAQREVELGSPALKTMAVHAQRMGKGFVSRAHRSTANAIYTVLEGEGRSRVGEQELEWRRGDVFVVPAWQPFSHTVAANIAYGMDATDVAVITTFGPHLLRRFTVWTDELPVPDIAMEGGFRIDADSLAATSPERRRIVG